MDIITGYRGAAHVSSADQQAIYHGLMNEAALVVLPVGSRFSVDDNETTIDIYDGVGCLHGIMFRIEDAELLPVPEFCSTGYHRKDLIAVRYTRESGGIESIALRYVTGTQVPTSSTATPPYASLETSGEPYEEANVLEAALYVVNVGDSVLTIAGRAARVTSSPEIAATLAGTLMLLEVRDITITPSESIPAGGTVSNIYSQLIIPPGGATVTKYSAPFNYPLAVEYAGPGGVDEAGRDLAYIVHNISSAATNDPFTIRAHFYKEI